MAKKVHLRMQAYTIIDDLLEGSIRLGIRRAYKHRDTSIPDEEIEAIVREVHNSIMNDLSEIIDWESSL